MYANVSFEPSTRSMYSLSRRVSIAWREGLNDNDHEVEGTHLFDIRDLRREALGDL